MEEGMPFLQFCISNSSAGGVFNLACVGPVSPGGFLFACAQMSVTSILRVAKTRVECTSK